MVTVMVNGHRWYWKYAPISEFLAVPLGAKWWHLWDSEREYIGHFPTKAAMMTHIAKIEEVPHV